MNDYEGVNDLEGLKSRVVANGGSFALPIEVLRDLHGYARLGRYVKAEISNKLLGVGLGHCPKELPDYQHEFVLLYQLGTPIARFVEAVLKPSATSHDVVRELASSEATSTLKQIRDLVCP